MLKTEKDYKLALACIESLMEGGRADEAELKLWAVLVEKYEEKHYPIGASRKVLDGSARL